MRLHEVIQTYLNGNFTTALEGAKYHPRIRIYGMLRREFGFDSKTANITSGYLKRLRPFQDAADAEFAMRERSRLARNNFSILSPTDALDT